MIATPDDYSWFSRERFPELTDAYCLTYVRDLTPEEPVTRLGVQVEDCSRMPLDELLRYSCTGSHRSRASGAVAVGGWVLIVEANGLLGVTEEIVLPLSAGTRLVSQPSRTRPERHCPGHRRRRARPRRSSRSRSAPAGGEGA
ncbi:DUF6461 domain-containing protein [Planomonospora corallina]|uniref:DUF6461 domain-containing protein n=1 Tax=Planomonospora corallina TaxID=1806052 RepID=A0ABV8IEI7_9ACTN